MLVHQWISILFVVFVLVYGVTAYPVAVGNPLRPSVESNFIGRSPKHLLPGTGIPPANPFSPLKYRKAFKINIPLKPKLFKHIHPTLHTKNVQYFKRDTKHAHHYEHKQVPFIKSLSMFLDHILPERNGIHDWPENAKYIKKRITKSNLEKSPEFDLHTGGTSIHSTIIRNHTTGDKTEEAVNVSTIESFKIFDTKNTTTTIDALIPSDLSVTKTSTSVPIISSTYSDNSWGTDDGHIHRNSTASNTDTTGSVSRHNGVVEYNTTVGTPEISSKSVRGYTNSFTRNSSDDGLSKGAEERGRIRIIDLSSRRHKIKAKTERNSKIGESNERLESANKSKGGRNTINEKFRIRLSRPFAKNKEFHIKKPIQPRNRIGESGIAISQGNSSFERVARGNDKIAQQTENYGASKGIKLHTDESNTSNIQNYSNTENNILKEANIKETVVNKSSIATISLSEFDDDKNLTDQIKVQGLTNVFTEKGHISDRKNDSALAQLRQSYSNNETIANLNFTGTPQISNHTSSKRLKSQYYHVSESHFPDLSNGVYLKNNSSIEQSLDRNLTASEQTGHSSKELEPKNYKISESHFGDSIQVIRQNKSSITQSPNKYLTNKEKIGESSTGLESEYALLNACTVGIEYDNPIEIISGYSNVIDSKTNT